MQRFIFPEFQTKGPKGASHVHENIHACSDQLRSAANSLTSRPLPSSSPTHQETNPPNNDQEDKNVCKPKPVNIKQGHHIDGI